jgi:PAS domain S-box-containing protein
VQDQSIADAGPGSFLKASLHPGLSKPVDAGLLLRIIQETPFAVTVLSAGEWRHVFANDAYHGLAGCDPSERTLREASPELADLMEPLLVQAVASGVRARHRGLRFQTPGGGPMWWDLKLIPLQEPDGAIESVLAILRDAGTDMQVRDSEAAAHSTLDALMLHIPEGVTIADAPAVVTRRISAYGLAMAGRSAEEVLGLDAVGNPAVWNVFHPDGRRYDPEQLPLSRATVHGEVVIDETVVLRRPDGTELALLCNAGPIRREDGSISGGVIVWRDITQQLQAATALREAVAFREVLLEELNHRVMNSLQLVTGLLKMQERRMAEPAAAAALAEAGSRVHVIAGAYRHLHHIDGIGRVALAPLLHDICAQIDGIRPGVRVSCAEIHGGLTLHADRAAPLGLVVNELLTNACKHAFPPGQPGSITVDVASGPDGTLHVVVTDDGVGFDVDAERSSGLGRSLVRSLTAQLGAVLEVSTGTTGGSRMTITLPAG